jgi:D-threonate/D-erythronate kinase
MKPSVVVIADDLTGACEIAGVALRHGLRSTVTLNATDSPLTDADLVVMSTETRLMQPLDAARRLVTVGAALAGASPESTLVYKKTDSALRGPIVAELEALALALKRNRILLVPANPALGRTIAHGRYFINGIPLPETTFADDPHHPARTAIVADLLGRPQNFAYASLPSPTPILEGTLAVGDAARPHDLAAWACHHDSTTLPAGGAAFFDALLTRRFDVGSHERERVDNSGGCERQRVDAPPASFIPADIPTLILSGTTVAEQRQQLAASTILEPLDLGDLDNRSALAAWISRLGARLDREHRAVTAMRGPIAVDRDRANGIRTALAAAALRMIQRHGLKHLVVEGGATAATVASALGWRTFTAVHEWTPGVVTLRPTGGSDHFLTVKPGSYPWPPILADAFLSPTH